MGTLGAQAGERETIAAAGLLNKGGIAQGLEDASRIAAHIIIDREDKAGGELSKRSSGTGKGGGVGEEGFGGEQHVILARQGFDIGCPHGFDVGDVICHPPEHLVNRLSGGTIRI